MAANTRRKTKDGGDGQPRRFAFSFSTGGLATAMTIAAAALAWAFVLGVLVGRGYKPEQAVPELARIMPKAEANATAPAPPEVLRAEELDFYDALNRKPGEAAAPAAKVAPAPKGPAPAAPAAAAAATTTAKPQAPAATAPAQAAPAPVAPAMQDAPGQRFAYVYQAAALRDAADARQFAARLQAKGLTTSIETVQAQGATWHRVLVHFQGTPEQTRTLKDTLAGVGVQKPIMKSKTPL